MVFLKKVAIGTIKGVPKNMTKKLHLLIILICSIVQSKVIATPTHVYVRNCTPLRFELSIDYEGATHTPQNFWQKGTDTIAPYDIPEEKNMVLSINRLLPQGEHLYTIKLIHGAETLYLKQKFISKSAQLQSELGISLESTCLHDPWFMNSQAKERHEHLLSINGHTIMVVYYAYDSDKSEDIEYTLYEKFSQPIEVATNTRLSGKTLAYSIAIPISMPGHSEPPRHTMANIIPKPLQYLARTILSAKRVQSTYHDTFAFMGNHSQSVDTNTGEWDILDLQKIIQIVSSPHDQLLNEGLRNAILTKKMQSASLSGQEMIDYIARKEAWYSGYSVVDSKRTRFWVPRNKIAGH